MFFRRRKEKPISFHEILLDSSNLPSFNVARLEGRMELPLKPRNIYMVGGIFALTALIFFGKLYTLQITHGAEFREKSEQNRLEMGLIVAERGIIYDRNGELVAWNEIDTTGQYDFPVRAYTDRRGFGQLIGYVSYPQKDKRGNYFRLEYLGRNGVEETYESILHGKNGKQLVEENAYGEVISRNAVEQPVAGEALTLSIDAELSEVMHDLIATSTAAHGFRSGAGAIMDLHTGEIIALTSYPSYDPEVLADGDDHELIASYNEDDRFPFLNKVVGGVYAPGSVVKPFLAYGVLKEGIIDPMKVIVSNGSLIIPNRYDPDNPAVFKDWKVYGAMTIREAIAYSSNVYFMTVGGGFGDQKGLGITGINTYMRMFGFGSPTGIALSGEQEGTVPNPEWKKEKFNDEWRLGDTYLTSIGQYGFLTTPLQMMRAYAALGNGGKLITPHVIKGERGAVTDLALDMHNLTIVREGMRKAVVHPGGTSRMLDKSYVEVAGKSGTAELGASKANVNSWIAGYFPYDKPQYAFVLFIENGPRTSTLAASTIFGKVLDWIHEKRPELLGISQE